MWCKHVLCWCYEECGCGTNCGVLANTQCMKENSKIIEQLMLYRLKWTPMSILGLSQHFTLEWWLCSLPLEFRFYHGSSNGCEMLCMEIVLKMFILDCTVFMKLYYGLKSLEINCLTSCQFFIWEGVVPWRPMVEFQDILKQECQVWLEIEFNPSTIWPLLCLKIQKLGKIVAPLMLIQSIDIECASYGILQL